MKFNKNMDKVLLKNGFKYYSDWEYGPMCSWAESWDRISLKLMKQDFGYWIIFHRHASGENISMNIGESNNAEDIIKLRDLLRDLKNSYKG